MGWFVWVACGWHLGTPPAPGLAVGEIAYVGAEPAVRADVERALTRRFAEVGVTGGAPVSVTIDAVESPDAAFPVDQGTVAWAWTWRVDFSVPTEPACRGDFVARRTWTVGPGAVADVASPRAAAVDALAAEVADRLVAAALATPACRALPRAAEGR